MTFEPTGFEGLLLAKPQVHVDARGFFMEFYNRRVFEPAGVKVEFVQDNHSSSRKGVLRGLHYQNAPHAQSKLVRVIAGRILDFVVDLRREQSTFGKVFVCELSADNKHLLYVPRGFGHGFAVLSDVAEVIYKCDDYYYPESAAGINIFDPALGIQKLIPKFDYILSAQDEHLPLLSDAKFTF